MNQNQEIAELKEKYKDDIDLVIILDKYDKLTTSPIKRSIDLFNHLDNLVGNALLGLDYIDLQSESKDVERIKQLMELHFNLSLKIHKGLAEESFVLTEDQENHNKTDRESLFTKHKVVKSSLYGELGKDLDK